MNNCATIVQLGAIRKHPNADKLMLTTIFGNQVIVGLDAKEGDIGIYFETGLQLSEEYATANDLIRRKDADGNPAGGMFSESRRVRTQKLRGEISDGFYTELKTLNFISKLNVKKLVVGFEFNDINGVEICKKYLPKTNRTSNASNAPKSKRVKLSSPMFLEHFDTAHFGKNIHRIQEGDRLILTEKIEGTSHRYMHGIVDNTHKINTIKKWLMKLSGITAKLDWQYLSGTRRVVLDDTYKRDTGFHEEGLRDNAVKPFVNNLHKSECLYYEISGYEPSGKTIMPIVDNKKLNDKEFVKQYGDKTIFSYGCKEGEFRIFVYRIAYTNIDGHQIDLSWNDVKKRCKELGVEHVPELLVIPSFDGDYDALTTLVEQYAEGSSSVDNTHIKEGVCVRVDGNIDLLVLKHKSFHYKVLSGIVKDAGVVDMEEQESNIE